MARAGWKKFRRLFWLSVLGIVVVAAVAATTMIPRALSQNILNHFFEADRAMIG